MPYIDFDVLQAQIGLMDVIKSCGLDRGRLNPLWKRSSCPLCRHSDPRALWVNWEKDTFYCHRCKRGGGPIQFASFALGLDNYHAALEICRRLGLEIPEKQITPLGRPRRDASGELHGGNDADDELV